MIDVSKYQLKTEVLGHTIKVIDQEGNDVVVIGSVKNPENIELANLFASAPRMYSALKEVIEITSKYDFGIPFAIEQAIKSIEGRL